MSWRFLNAKSIDQVCKGTHLKPLILRGSPVHAVPRRYGAVLRTVLILQSKAQAAGAILNSTPFRQASQYLPGMMQTV